ncbi:OmpH family outer membrane protein [Magnetovibrio sp.]|uniref:OmpH family outer membrane protein n=1 Tax=Magnetovibrio sp. TaxID=2024836 RepID=UPI002F92B09E
MTLKSIAFSCAVLLGALSFAPVVSAQDAAPNEDPRGGVVYWAILDTDGVFAESKAMKDIHEQMAKYQAEIQAVIDKEKDAVQKEEEELMRKRNLLAPEVLAEERKKFQDRIVGLQRRVQETNLKLNQVRAEATEKVTDVYRSVVADVVKINQISMVFQKAQVVYADPKLDISAIVLQDLDARLPSVQVANPNK